MSAHRRSVSLTLDARIDFSDILLYSEQQWGKRQRNAYRAVLLRGFGVLRDHPLIGVVRDDLGPGLRTHHVGSHILYYTSEDEAVTILRILHERSDAARHIILS